MEKIKGSEYFTNALYSPTVHFYSVSTDCKFKIIIFAKSFIILLIDYDFFYHLAVLFAESAIPEPFTKRKVHMDSVANWLVAHNKEGDNAEIKK